MDPVDYQSLLSLCPEALLACDPEDRIVYWSPGAQGVYGWTQEEALGQQSGSLLGTVFPVPWESIAVQLATRGCWTGELRQRHRDGSELQILACWAARQDRRGVLQRNSPRHDLQRKSDFLAGMSHELRTPLNAIIGFSEVLSQQTFGPLNPKQLRYLDSVSASGRHLLQLIEGLLDLSHLASGRVVLERTCVQLPQCLQEAVEEVRRSAPDKAQELTVVVHDSSPVWADQSRLRQVLLNLLRNAIQFTPESGTITVEVEGAGPMVCVSVKDTGVGVALQDQERIFWDFEQAQTGYARTQGGSGLGLALSRRLIRLHGGEITLVSEPGQGSCFSFSLPRFGEDPSQDGKGGCAHESPGGGGQPHEFGVDVGPFRGPRHRGVQGV